MNNKVRSRVNNLIVVMTVIVFALSLIATAFFAFSEDASALSTTVTSVKIGNGEELYDRSSGEINRYVADDMTQKLFGDADPVEYIKTNGAEDWETYGKDSPSELAGDPYYVVPASTINARIEDNVKKNNGFVIKIGGLEWMVASLTLADTEKGNDNVIATLYLATSTNEMVAINASVNTNENIKGDNAYSSSTMRNSVLLNKNNSNWKLFNGGEGSFAEDYLVQPKNVKYQHTESICERNFAVSRFTMPNDAISRISSGWNPNNPDLDKEGYKPEEVFGGHRYDEWGNDYIWLPSLVETGEVGMSSNSSIWKLSNAQLSSNEGGWLRSAHNNVYMFYYYLHIDGTRKTNYANEKYGVRPAIHLNLSAIGFSFGLQDPEDVSTTYNAENQTLYSILANDKEAADWYDSEWYEHNKEYVKLTYSNSEMSDIGEYWMKAEIQQNWIDDVRAAVDADATANGWTEEEKERAYELRRPKFFGKADIGDPDHMESDTVRWCKLVINKRKIGLEFSTDSRGMPVGEFKSLIEGDNGTGIYDGDTLENGRMPVLGFRYSGRGSTTYPSSTTPPTKQGTYTATAYLVNADDTPYELDTSSLTTDFEIVKALPSFSAVDISVTYGTAYEVDITTDSDSAVTVTYYQSDGKTPVAGNAKPTDTGVYIAKLSTEETANFAADVKAITITINIAKPTVNPVVPEKVYYHEGDAMPEIKLSDGDTSGSIKWATGSIVQLGPHTYTWEYTPSDTKNYESASGEIELNFLPVALGAVKVESFTQGDTVIYAGSDINALKSMLKVALYNNDGTKNKDLTDGEYTLTGELVAGESEITVSSSGFSTTFTVNVTAESMTGINAVFTQGSVKVFATTDIDSLKEYLKVTAVYNSGRTEDIASGDYTLSGTLSVGTSAITVAYSGKETTFNVTVSEIAVESITAAFTQGTNEVFTSTDISKLKEWLVVTATYNDGSEKSVTDYELAGNLIAGSSYIVVKFGGKETTFTVNVTEVKAVSMDVTYTKGTVFVGASLDTLKGSITVKITYNDGNIDEDFKGYVLEGSLATAGDVTVKVRYLTFEKDIVVTVSDITVTNIEITFAQNGTVIFEGSNIDILKDMLTVKVTYSNGDVEEDYKGYTLTGDLSVSGSVTVTVECGDESDTFTVEVTAIEITEITAEFKQGSNAIYPSFGIDGLKEWLTVNAIYNDATKNKTLSDEEYTLSGTLEAGTSTITVTYEGKETTFTVSVSEVSLDRIEVTFEQGDSVIYESASLDTLKQYMSVKAIYSDKSEKTLEDSEYTVTGTLSVSSTILVVEYNGKTATIMSGVTVTKVEAVSMEVTYTEGAVFAGASLDTLRPNITVKVTYNDGSVNEDFKDYTLEGSLDVEGETTVTVKYLTLEKEITVTVSDIRITDIEVAFAQSGTIFEGSDIEILKDMLTVKVTYSNGEVDEDYKGYTLTGDLTTVGTVSVTVTLGDISKNFDVEVTAIELTEITAEFKQGSNVIIYPSFDIDGLKEWLTVNAIYNDTTKNKVLSDEDYVLSGTLEVGTSTITVTYEGKDTTFTVSVSEAALDRIEVTFEQGDSVIYESAPLDTLKQYMSVKAVYGDKSEKTLEDSEYTVTGTLSVSSTILVVEYNGKSATITSGVTVTKVVAVSMEVTYMQSGIVNVGANLDTLRDDITVKVTYNDGNIDEDYKDYTLEGSLNVMGESEVKIKVGELEDTITVNVSTSEFIKKPEVTTPSVVFDNEEHTVEEFITGFNDYTMEFVEKPDVIKSVGEYTVRIKIKDDKAVAWEESEDRAEVTLTFSVERLVIDIPSEGGELEYTGEEQSFVPEGIDTDLVTLSGNVGTEVGEYTVTVSLNYPSDTCFTGGSVEDMTFTFSIVKKRLERPTVSAPENIVYTGEEIDVSGMLEGFSSELMTLSGNVKGTNADTYVISITITDADHYEWAEEESEEIEVALSNNAITIEIEWKINKAKLMPEWTSASGVPTFKVPDKYKDLLKFEYVYEDENGNEVKKEDFESGKTYKVIAKLSEECKGNFEFVTSSGEVLDKPEESAPYEFMPAGGNVTPPDDNEPTEPNIVGMPDWILTWLIVMSCFMGVMLFIMVTMFICMILIAMRKNNGSTVYNYPPYTSQYEDEDEYDDEDEDDEDETDGSGREGEASGREANDGDDKEDARRSEEIAAANSDSGRYVPEGAVVIAEGQLANKDEAKRLEDDGSFYAFEKRDGESVVTVADGAVIINGSERLDIKDSILLLGDDEKRYIFGLRDYAIERSGEKPSFAKYHLTVGKGTKQVIKLSVKDGEVMAYFRIEDERLRTIRRNARENDAEIKIKETEMAVDGESAYEMAKDLIDLRVTQIEENLEYRKQLLKEKRKAKKELSKNSGNQLEDGDGSADRDIDG